MSRLLGMVGPILVDEFRDYLDPGTIPPDVPPGTGGQPVNLLTCELLRRDWRVVLFALDHGVKHEYVMSGPQLKICMGGYTQRPARRFFAAEIDYLTRAIERERPDVLHAQWTYEYALGAIGTSIPHVVTAHDAPVNVLRLNFIPYRMARTLLAYRALWKAKRVVAVSPYVRDHLKRWGFHFRPIEVIGNGMPESLFARGGKKQEARDGVTFATVLMGWGGRKNGQVALAALGELLHTCPNSKLIMFGDGHGPGEPAETWARGRGLSRNVEFVGRMAHAALLERLAAEVDVLVHPALEEAQPMSLIEAMALGIPVIGGRESGGVPWTLNEGKAGILVDVRSPLDIATAMIKLASDPAERRALGQRGREFALANFHIRAVADAYERIYKELYCAQRETPVAGAPHTR